MKRKIMSSPEKVLVVQIVWLLQFGVSALSSKVEISDMPSLFFERDISTAKSCVLKESWVAGYL